MAETKTREELLESDLFQELLAEGVAMQHRFKAEPVFAKTGKGYLKSEGVEELQRIKKEQQEHSETSK